MKNRFKMPHNGSGGVFTPIQAQKANCKKRGAIAKASPFSVQPLFQEENE